MWIRAALFSALLWGCAEDKNQPPSLLPVGDFEVRVNEDCTITIRATDEDRDELGYAFSIDPPPLTQTQGLAAQPTLTRISNNEALFTWTPGIADAGGEDLRIYQLTFEVVDEHGALDAVTIKVTVVNDGGV
ncbi:hypothetical protein KKF91_14245, partial [Myxococcota bacterium]|nr:hypothetical protein [Myxococcota bacterium]